MTLYAYCLSDEVTAPMLEELAGLEGAWTSLLTLGDIRAVVSEFEGEMVSVTRENVFAHERVLQSLLRHTTPLPFRFATLVSRERLENYVNENREALLCVLEEVRGSVEMSVKIIWDADDVRREGLAGEQESEGLKAQGSATAQHAGQGKGAAYLAARRREILGDELLKSRAEEIAGWLKERLGGAARAHRIDVRPAESLFVRAGFLVERARLELYRARLKEALNERSALRFLTSGPWPPYSFSNIKP
jgi:hypothetical protein